MFLRMLTVLCVLAVAMATDDVIGELGAPDKEGPTAPGYILIPGFGYYKYSEDRVLWSEAERFCLDEGTHLVILNSQEEADILMETFDLPPGFDSGTFFFAGIHRLGGDDENWRTVEGVPLSETGYSRWFNNGYEPAGNYTTAPYGGYNWQNPLPPLRYGYVTVKEEYTWPFFCEYNDSNSTLPIIK